MTSYIQVDLKFFYYKTGHGNNKIKKTKTGDVYMSVKSIEKSFVYQLLNKNDAISKSIVSILTKGQRLTKENMEEAFIIINKNFKFPLKYKVLEAIAQEDIIMMYSPPETRIPTCLPFFLTRDGNGKAVAVVVIDLYGKMNPENQNVNIDPKKLYCILEGALFALTYYQHSGGLSKRNVIISSGSSIYSNMFTRVLNKKYSLNVDRVKQHKVLLLASKFYMINVLGMPDTEMAYNYALQNCPSGNHHILKEVNDMMKEEDYKDLSTFILALTRPEFGLKMNDLTVRGYMEMLINMYDASILLGMELFPYFMYNINSVVNGAYLNRQYALEDIVDKHGVKLYNDMLNFNR
ncbi:hypothetical protein D1872_36090 [compost metagenome]